MSMDGSLARMGENVLLFGEDIYVPYNHGFLFIYSNRNRKEQKIKDSDVS